MLTNVFTEKLKFVEKDELFPQKAKKKIKIYKCIANVKGVAP